MSLDDRSLDILLAALCFFVAIGMSAVSMALTGTVGFALAMLGLVFLGVGWFLLQDVRGNRK